jgi:hypothetical protein
VSAAYVNARTVTSATPFPSESSTEAFSVLLRASMISSGALATAASHDRSSSADPNPGALARSTRSARVASIVKRPSASVVARGVAESRSQPGSSVRPSSSTSFGAPIVAPAIGAFFSSMIRPKPRVRPRSAARSAEAVAGDGAVDGGCEAIGVSRESRGSESVGVALELFDAGCESVRSIKGFAVVSGRPNSGVARNQRTAATNPTPIAAAESTHAPTIAPTRQPRMARHNRLLLFKTATADSPAGSSPSPPPAS